MVKKHANHRSCVYFEQPIYSMILEWIPFGENTLISTSKKLEIPEEESIYSVEKYSKKLLTEQLDEDPENATFETTGIPTSVKAEYYSKKEGVIKFDCQVFYRETFADLQEEHFSVYIDSLGRIIYGFKLENISYPRSESKHVSLDMMCAVIADVLHDSSQVLDGILLKYQKKLLELIFFEEPLDRDKYIIINCKNLRFSNLESENVSTDTILKILKRDCTVINEIRQLIGNYYIMNVNNKILLLGQKGTVVIGEYDDALLCKIINLGYVVSIGNVLDNTFATLWHSWEKAEDLRKKMLKLWNKRDVSLKDINKIYREASNLYSNILLIRSILDHIKTSLLRAEKELSKLKNGDNLVEIINNELETIKSRIVDATPIANDLEKSITGLISLAQSFVNNYLTNLMDAMKENTKKSAELIDSMRRNARESAKVSKYLEALEAIIISVYAVEFIHLLYKTWCENDLLMFWLFLLIGCIGLTVSLYLLLKSYRKFNKECYNDVEIALNNKNI